MIQRLIALLGVALLVASVAVTPASADHPSTFGVADCPADEFAASRVGHPPPWFGAMPRPRSTEYAVDDARVSSRDGTGLAVRVYRPTAFSGRLPTVLWMTPYSSSLPFYAKEAEDFGFANHWDCFIPFFLERGYAVVWADMRGTHDSEGCTDFGGRKDREDAYAVVQWIAGRPWSNGRVGMRGLSWEGMIQYAAAVAAPPALKAIVPGSATGWLENFRPGGTLHELAFTEPIVSPLVTGGPPTDPAALGAWSGRQGCQFDRTSEVLLGPPGSPWWRERDLVAMVGRIRAAVFHTVGYPLDNQASWGRWMVALRAKGVPHHGLIGPWGHQFPDVPYYPYHELRWFEHWLKGHDTGVMREPRYTFVDRARVVRRSNVFPGPKRLVLHAGGGALAQRVPTGSATYQDVPSVQRPVVWRTDALHLDYVSPAWNRPVRVSGPPSLELVASIDAVDTNFAAHLFDVAPDGTESWLGRGYLDALYRRGFDRAEPVEPGKRERYVVTLETMEHVVAPGHRLLLRLSSTDSCLVTGDVTRDPVTRPVCDENGGLFGVVSDRTFATVTVHEGGSGTRLILPTAPV